MSKILYKNCQKYLPSKSRLWGQILFWKTHQNPTLQNCQNFQKLSKIVKNIGYMMPSFGGWMFLLDICCQLLEKIWTWRSFRWLTRRWPTLSTSRWLKSFVRLNFNPSHIDQWMRMSVSNSHRGTTASRPTKGCGEKSYHVARNPTTWKESQQCGRFSYHMARVPSKWWDFLPHVGFCTW